MNKKEVIELAKEMAESRISPAERYKWSEEYQQSAIAYNKGINHSIGVLIEKYIDKSEWKSICDQIVWLYRPFNREP